eukprot:jgi/Undpi1/10621/HiC_scaffold_29.g13071.m1
MNRRSPRPPHFLPFCDDGSRLKKKGRMPVPLLTSSPQRVAIRGWFGLTCKPSSNPCCAEVGDDYLSGLWLLGGGGTDGPVVDLTDSDTDEIVVSDPEINQTDTKPILSASHRVGYTADNNALGNVRSTVPDTERSAQSEASNVVDEIVDANPDPIVDVYPGPIPNNVLEECEEEGVDARVYAMFQAIAGAVVGVNGETVSDGYDVDISDLRNGATKTHDKGDFGGVVEDATAGGLGNMDVSADSGGSSNRGIVPDLVENVALAASSGDVADSKQADGRDVAPDPLEPAAVVTASGDAMRDDEEKEKAQPTLAGAMKQLGALTDGLEECQVQAGTLGETLRILAAEKKREKKGGGGEEVEGEDEEEVQNRREALAAVEASAMTVSAASAKTATATAAEAAVGSELVSTAEATAMEDNAAARRVVNDADKAVRRSRGFLLLEAIICRRHERETFAAFRMMRRAASTAVEEELAIKTPTAVADTETEAEAAALEGAVAKERETSEKIAEEANDAECARVVAEASAAKALEEKNAQEGRGGGVEGRYEERWTAKRPWGEGGSGGGGGGGGAADREGWSGGRNVGVRARERPRGGEGGSGGGEGGEGRRRGTGHREGGTGGREIGIRARDKGGREHRDLGECRI